MATYQTVKRTSRTAKRKKGRMTTAEYFQTEETLLPRELAFGELRVADAPLVPHQRVVRDLTIALTAHTREHRLGEVLPAPLDVVLDYERALVVQPDIVFVASEHMSIVADRLYGVPDLAIEVLSPQPRIGRLEERVGWFARYGVRECWLVDLARRHMAVLTLDARGVVDRALAGAHEPIVSRVLPGLRLRPNDVLGWGG
jgi:Uma2 family endonuclease